MLFKGKFEKLFAYNLYCQLRFLIVLLLTTVNTI